MLESRIYEEPELSEVLERVPMDVRRTLTFEQRAALSKALVDTRARHSVDVRVPIPLLFTQLYFVVFVGKDRRKTTETRMRNRQIEAGRWSAAGLISVFGLALGLATTCAAYYAKSRSGIDMFAEVHAKDILQGFGL